MTKLCSYIYLLHHKHLFTYKKKTNNQQRILKVRFNAWANRAIFFCSSQKKKPCNHFHLVFSATPQNLSCATNDILVSLRFDFIFAFKYLSSLMHNIVHADRMSNKQILR